MTICGNLLCSNSNFCVVKINCNMEARTDSLKCDGKKEDTSWYVGCHTQCEGMDSGAAHSVPALFIRQNTQFQGSPVGQQQTSTVRGIAGRSSELN